MKLKKISSGKEGNTYYVVMNNHPIEIYPHAANTWSGARGAYRMHEWLGVSLVERTIQHGIGPDWTIPTEIGKSKQKKWLIEMLKKRVKPPKFTGTDDEFVTWFAHVMAEFPKATLISKVDNQDGKSTYTISVPEDTYSD